MAERIRLASESDHYNAILNEILDYINRMGRAVIRANMEVLAMSLRDMSKFLATYPITYEVVEEAEEMLEEKEFSQFNGELLYLASCLEQLWEESSKNERRNTGTR